MGPYDYRIMHDFCEINSVFKGIFKGFAFWKVFFGFYVSGKIFFLGRSEIPNSADPCL